VAALLSSGAQTSAGADSLDGGPLHRSALFSGSAVTAQLLAAKDGVEAASIRRGKDGATPCHLALDPRRRERGTLDEDHEGESDEENLETLSAILKKAKDVAINVEDSDGQTALHW